MADTGLDELRAAVERMTAALPAPPTTATRLWVDRVFTVRGAGTVVTGTLGSGRIAAGDQLIVAPSGETVPVRGIEMLKTQVPETSAVARVAVNLRGTKRVELRRGDALVRPGEWTVTDLVDVRLTDAAASLPGRPIVHVGSAAVSAHLRSLDGGTARLRLERPLPLHVGDRAILRDPGPQRVVAGAVVLDVLPPPLARRGAARRRAEELATMTARPDVAAEVARRRTVRLSALRAAGVPIPSRLPDAVVAVGDWLVDDDTWRRWQVEVLEIVDRWAAARPDQPGMPRAAAAQALALPHEPLIDALVAAVPPLTSDTDGVHRRDVTAQVSPAVRRALDDLRTRLTVGPFDAPDLTELSDAGLTEAHLAAATKRGELLRVAAGVYLLPESLHRATEILTGLPQPFTLSQARQALGTSRRVAVPLLELLDRSRATQRVDAQRRSIRTPPS